MLIFQTHSIHPGIDAHGSDASAVGPRVDARITSAPGDGDGPCQSPRKNPDVDICLHFPGIMGVNRSISNTYSV